MPFIFYVGQRVIAQKSSLIVLIAVVLGALQKDYVTSATLNFFLSSVLLILVLSMEFYQLYFARAAMGVVQIPFLRQVGKIAIFHLCLLFLASVISVLGLILMKATGLSFFSWNFGILAVVSFLFLFILYLIGTAIVIHSESSFFSPIVLGKNILSHGLGCIFFSIGIIALMVAQSSLDIIPVFLESFPVFVVLPGKIFLGLIIYFVKCTYLTFLSMRIK